MINSVKFVERRQETVSSSQFSRVEPKQLSQNWGKYAVYRWDLQDYKVTNAPSDISLSITGDDYCLIGVPEFLSSMSGSVYNYVKKMGESNHGNVKWYIALQVVLEKGVKHTEGEQVIRESPTYYSGYRELLDSSNNECKFKTQYENAVDIINNRFQEWHSKGSGWRLIGFKWLDLGVSQYDPIYAGCYMQLPQAVKGRVINVSINNSGNENKCFQLAILAHILPEPTNRMYRDTWLLKHANLINMEGIKHPVTMQDVDRFEDQNPDFAIFVLAYDIVGTYDYKRGDKIVTKDRFRSRAVYVHRKSENRTAKHIIHLLMLNKLDTQQHHFTLINTKNGVNGLSRLLRGVKESGSAALYCPFCLHRFYSNHYRHNMETNLAAHIELCREHKVQRTEMPNQWRKDKEGDWIRCDKLQYSNYTPTLRVPFVIYFTIYGKSLPVGYSFVVIDECGKLYKKEAYSARDEDALNVCEKLLLRLWELKTELEPIILENKSITFTDDQRKNYFKDNDNVCVLCRLDFAGEHKKDLGWAVDHHSHTTGQFIGRAHNKCNLQCKRPVVIPVISHNLCKFGMHHLVRSLYVFKGKVFTKCLATNTEQVNSIELHELRSRENKNDKDKQRSPVFLRFLDSCKFLQEDRLDKMTNDLRYSCTERNKSSELLKLKNTFPITASEFKLHKNKNLLHQENMWKKLIPILSPFSNQMSDINRNQLADIDFNMRSEVTLLADVFQRYRNMIYSRLGLDPCHFFSSSHVTYQAALKYTQITTRPRGCHFTCETLVGRNQIGALTMRFGYCFDEIKFSLDLVTDPTMYLFFEKGIRGGPSIVPHRYARCNDPRVTGGYDESKPIQIIKHFDVKSLYGSCMRERLPVGCFQWIDNRKLEEYENLMSGDDRDDYFPDDSYYGCILEVDLEYPQSLHDLHKDFPLAPQKETVNQYIEPSRVAMGSSGVRYINTEKLLLTLNDKHNYVLHYRVLKQYLKYGLKLKKIHRGVEFYQEAWLKPYIDHLWDSQHNSATKYEKQIWKHLIVSLSGKTIENSRNYVDLKLVYDEKNFIEINSSPRVERVLVFNSSRDDEAVIGMVMTPRAVKLRKPVYLGMTIMDLGKLSMYKLHYDHFVSTYGPGNLQLLYHDTDSLTYSLTVDKEQELELRNIKTSYTKKGSLSRQFPHVFAGCKWDIGTLKDETDGEPIQEHIGLSPKMYSYVSGFHTAAYSTTEKQVAKGVNQRECPLDHQMYKECLFHDQEFGASINTWRSILHKNTLLEQFRRTLSPRDDTRVVLQDKVSTLPYGHYSLYESNNNDESDKKRDREDDKELNPFKRTKLE